jgi:hypothetical protein
VVSDSSKNENEKQEEQTGSKETIFEEEEELELRYIDALGSSYCAGEKKCYGVDEDEQ